MISMDVLLKTLFIIHIAEVELVVKSNLDALYFSQK